MIKILIETGPLIVFFIGYKYGGILTAALWLLVASVIALAAGYLRTRKIEMVTLISTALVLVSSSLTLLVGDSSFIKMKPTILYLVFAIIFFGSIFSKKTAVEYMLEKAIKLDTASDWVALNLRFVVFFILMAIFNEYIWRNYSEETWVNFKVFGFLPATLLFILTQIPFVLKRQSQTDQEIIPKSQAVSQKEDEL